MSNERLTEDMVEALLHKYGFYDDPDAIAVEKQQSTIIAIRTALSKASKSGKGGAGYPEFIITAMDTPDMVVVIECKADITKHESKDYNRPAEYAVDGVLHYARWLSPKYTVIAIAVSGNEKGSRWSIFLVPKGESESKQLVAPTGAVIDGIVPMEDLIRAASFDPTVHADATPIFFHLASLISSETMRACDQPRARRAACRGVAMGGNRRPSEGDCLVGAGLTLPMLTPVDSCQLPNATDG